MYFMWAQISESWRSPLYSLYRYILYYICYNFNKKVEININIHIYPNFLSVEKLLLRKDMSLFTPVLHQEALWQWRMKDNVRQIIARLIPEKFNVICSYHNIQEFHKLSASELPHHWSLRDQSRLKTILQIVHLHTLFTHKILVLIESIIVWFPCNSFQKHLKALYFKFWK